MPVLFDILDFTTENLLVHMAAEMWEGLHTQFSSLSTPEVSQGRTTHPSGKNCGVSSRFFNHMKMYSGEKLHECIDCEKDLQTSSDNF